MKRIIGRADDGTLISIKELNTSNLGYFQMYCLNYRHNYAYRKNLKSGLMVHVWQKESTIARIYKRIPRKMKKIISPLNR